MLFYYIHKGCNLNCPRCYQALKSKLDHATLCSKSFPSFPLHSELKQKSLQWREASVPFFHLLENISNLSPHCLLLSSHIASLWFCGHFKDDLASWFSTLGFSFAFLDLFSQMSSFISFRPIILEAFLNCP